MSDVRKKRAKRKQKRDEDRQRKSSFFDSVYGLCISASIVSEKYGIERLIRMVLQGWVI